MAPNAKLNTNYRQMRSRSSAHRLATRMPVLDRFFFEFSISRLL